MLLLFIKCENWKISKIFGPKFVKFCEKFLTFYIKIMKIEFFTKKYQSIYAKIIMFLNFDSTRIKKKLNLSISKTFLIFTRKYLKI